MRFLRTGVLVLCLPLAIVVVPVAIVIGILGCVLLALYEWVMEGRLQ